MISKGSWISYVQQISCTLSVFSVFAAVTETINSRLHSFKDVASQREYLLSKARLKAYNFSFYSSSLFYIYMFLYLNLWCFLLFIYFWTIFIFISFNINLMPRIHTHICIYICMYKKDIPMYIYIPSFINTIITMNVLSYMVQ